MARPAKPRLRCSIDGCDRLHRARGFCDVHYSRWRIHGDPNVNLLPDQAKPGELMAFVEKALQHESDDCLLWPYALGGAGYGAIRVDGRQWKAHRYVCQQAHGEPASAGLVAAHSCRTPACVNPRHLRWATPLQNSGDRYVHGTIRFGERHHNARLADHEVHIIRRLAPAVSTKELAERFGTSISTVNRIIRGRTRANIAHSALDRTDLADFLAREKTNG